MHKELKSTYSSLLGGMCVCVQLCVTPWTVAHQAPLFMGFSRQAYRSGLPFPPPGDLPDPGIEHASPAFLALAGGFFTTNATWASFLTLLSFSSEIVPNFQNYCKKQRFMDCRVIGIQRQSLPCRTQGVPHHTWPVACFDGDKERVKRAGKLTGPW